MDDQSDYHTSILEAVVKHLLDNGFDAQIVPGHLTANLNLYVPSISVSVQVGQKQQQMHLVIVGDTLHANTVWPGPHTGAVFPLSDPTLLDRLVIHIDHWLDTVSQLVLLGEIAAQRDKK